MKNLFYFLILASLSLLQVTAFNHLEVFSVKPDLLLGFVVVSSVLLNWKIALLFGAIAGVFKDLFGSSGFGINTFLLPLWSFLIFKLSRKIAIEDPVALSVTAFVIVLFNDIVSRVLFFSFGRYVSPGVFLKVALLESAYTAIALPLVIIAFDYINESKNN